MSLTPPPSAPPAAPTAPGDAPTRANPSTFRALADAFVAWLVTFRDSLADMRTWLADYITWAGTNVTELDALQADVTTKSETATTKASEASTSATNAATSETNAAASRAAIDNRIYPGTYDPATPPTTKPVSGAPSADGDEFSGTDGYRYARVGGAWVNQTQAAAASATAAATSEANATEQAGLATTERTAAQAAQVASELARDAATNNAGVYGSQGAGLAATSSGDYFSVPNEDDSRYLTLYLNNAGVAQEVAQYPSLSAVQSALGSAPETASSLLGAEPEGLSIVLTTNDTAAQVKVVDAATPANDYEGSLLDFIATTCFPSPKIVTLEDGSLGWSEHNLIYNSEGIDSANWVRTGLTASAKDANGLNTLTATGTTAKAKAGIQSFLAGLFHVGSVIVKQGTAPFGYVQMEGTTVASAWFNFSTGLFETVDAGLTATPYTTYPDGSALPTGEYRLVFSRQISSAAVSANIYYGLADADASTAVTVGRTGYFRRASASRGVKATQYLKTTTGPRYGIPYDWSTGVRAVLIEEVLSRFRSKFADDLTQAAWVKTNCTPALDAVGPHGEPCSTLTADAADATCLQSVTSAATSNTFQARVKRKTGSGAVYITADGGATWTDITADLGTSAFALVYTHRTGTTAVNFGFKLATSGDAIEVSLAVVNENAFLTSPFPTADTGASYNSRSSDLFRIPFTKFHTGAEYTAFFDFHYGEDASGVDAFCGVRGASDLHYVGLDDNVFLVRLSIVGGTTYRNWIADAPADRRVEGAFRVKANDVAGTANGFGECYDNRLGAGTVDNVFAGNGSQQVFLRRILIAPRALSDDELADWRYSGNGADARYLADKKVVKFGEMAGTHICREPTVEVLKDTDLESVIAVAFMQRNATNNTGNAELPGRLMLAQYRFDKTTETLTQTVAPAVLQEQAIWSTGYGHLQGPKIMKIRGRTKRGRIVCVFTQLDSLDGTLATDWRNLYAMYSDDNGVTWSAPVLILDSGSGNASITNGGDYVEFTEGAYAGRIAVPFYDNSGCGVIYSDDQGATWTAGTTTNVGAEPTLHLLPDGTTLVMTIRQETSPWRTYAKSTDGGATFSASSDFVGFDGTRVSMSVVQNDPDGGEGMYGEQLLVGARNTSPTYLYRSKLTVEEMVGSALTPSGTQFTPLGIRRATGYASAKRMSGGYLAIGYESTPTADPNNICEIRMAVVRWP